MVGGVIEGADGLLTYSTEMITCRWPDTFAYPVAVSADGVNWKPVTAPAELIQVLDGSAAGYLAVGASGVFTSPNGVDWSKANLTGSEFAGLDAIEGGAAFGGGLVIAGIAQGPQNDGCGARGRPCRRRYGCPRRERPGLARLCPGPVRESRHRPACAS
jgi:uncharacterized membrane protein YedE/YeeE